MAADPHHIDPTAYLEELLTQASPDLMRQMLTDFINQILSAQADTVCGADYATVSAERTNTRNGYRHRQLDTGPGARKVDTSGVSYAAWVSVAELSASKSSGARRLHQECRLRVL